MIHRFSFRNQPLNTSFIQDRLKGAVSYDRIAGFFRSSLLEVAEEPLESLDGKIRVVCNSEIDQRDVCIAKDAQQALRKSWCGGEPEKLGEKSKDRFSRLYEITKDKRTISNNYIRRYSALFSWGVTNEKCYINPF